MCLGFRALQRSSFLKAVVYGGEYPNIRALCPLEEKNLGPVYTVSDGSGSFPAQDLPFVGLVEVCLIASKVKPSFATGVYDFGFP